MGPPMLNVAASRGAFTCNSTGARPSNWSALQPIMAGHFGPGFSFETRVERSAAAAPAPVEPAPPVAPAPTPPAATLTPVAPEQAGPHVRRALKHFPGTVKKERR